MTFEFVFFDSARRSRLFKKRPVEACPTGLPDYRRLYSRATRMVWQEHCVECAPPDCYATCVLYEPGVTADCRRFEYGIYRDSRYRGLMGYGAEIAFRRWAKLEAVWNTTLLPQPQLRLLEYGYLLLARLAKAISYVSYALRRRHWYPVFRMRQTRFFTRQNATPANRPDTREYPDMFIVDVVNQEAVPVDFQIRFSQMNTQRAAGVYEETLRLAPGFTHHEIAYPTLVLALGDVQEALIAVTLGNNAAATLTFTALDFVKTVKSPAGSDEGGGSREPAAQLPKVKCVVWDLDNTFWDGTLIADGAEKIRMRPEVRQTVTALDRRGILHSIASKNNFDEAWPAVSQTGLQEYFLFSQIHWGLKSESIKRIAQRLNIGLDTIAFIDDSPFELAEVHSALPLVRCYRAAEAGALARYPEFDVPVTPDAQQRRLTYKAIQNFEESEQAWRENRIDFLKSCRMVLTISLPQPSQAERCYELLQRTNQLNLSGVRYTREEFQKLLSLPGGERFVVQVADRFGDYGTVGFAAVRIDGDGPCLHELVISCRVSRRQIEHTLLLWLARRYAAKGFSCLRVSLRPTSRNGLLAQALTDVGCRRSHTENDIQKWEFLLPAAVPETDVMLVCGPEEPGVLHER